VKILATPVLSARQQLAPPLPDHQYGSGALRGVPVYSIAFAGSRKNKKARGEPQIPFKMNASTD